MLLSSSTFMHTSTSWWQRPPSSGEVLFTNTKRKQGFWGQLEVQFLAQGHFCMLTAGARYQSTDPPISDDPSTFLATVSSYCDIAFIVLENIRNYFTDGRNTQPF